jgi:cell division protein ZapA
MSTAKTIAGTIYGKEYTLACDVGQERHLTNLVGQVDMRAKRLESAIGKLPESMMLVYTALMLADELHEATKEKSRLETELDQARRLLEQAGPAGNNAQLEDAVAENVMEIATRIDALSAKLAA